MTREYTVVQNYTFKHRFVVEAENEEEARKKASMTKDLIGWKDLKEIERREGLPNSLEGKEFYAFQRKDPKTFKELGGLSLGTGTGYIVEGETYESKMKNMTGKERERYYESFDGVPDFECYT